MDSASQRLENRVALVRGSGATGAREDGGVFEARLQSVTAPRQGPSPHLRLDARVLEEDGGGSAVARAEGDLGADEDARRLVARVESQEGKLDGRRLVPELSRFHEPHSQASPRRLFDAGRLRFRRRLRHRAGAGREQDGHRPGTRLESLRHGFRLHGF